ncbi:TPA: hypothetical protein U5D40_001221 [Yersinia enterocolitica]|nr:hypothetical protein [Yersinia enterocolitica]
MHVNVRQQLRHICFHPRLVNALNMGCSAEMFSHFVLQHWHLVRLWKSPIRLFASIHLPIVMNGLID